MRTLAVCPSDFALERLLLGELPEGATDIARHVDGCEACRAKIEAKKADSNDFMRSGGAEDLRRRLGEPSVHPAQSASADPHPVTPLAGGRRVALRGYALTVFAVAAAVAVSFAVSRRYGEVPSKTSVVDKSRDEAVVLRVQREWMEAIRDKDAAALDRILADDYTYTDSRGRVSNKADSLRQARSTSGRLTSFQTSDEKAHLFGDTAIVTGLLRVEGISGGEAYDAEVRFTDILARIDGEWRAVAAHASKP